MHPQQTHTYKYVYVFADFPGGSVVKNLPEMQKMWVQSLEKEMAAHSSIHDWQIPWTEKPPRAIIHGVTMSLT